MNNWEHLSTSWTNLRISIEYLWSIEGILRTSENSWEHRKTSKIIWYHPMNNWGPIIDNLVQFEEDFNSRTEMWWSGGDRIGYVRPDQFLDHLTVMKSCHCGFLMASCILHLVEFGPIWFPTEAFDRDEISTLHKGVPQNVRTGGATARKQYKRHTLTLNFQMK